MQKQVTASQVNACSIERVLDAVMQMAVGGQCFAERDLAGSFVKTGHVGKGAANIHGDTQGFLGCSHVFLSGGRH